MYRDYIATLEQYQKPIWTCRYTGKSNLTFEEALLSEKKAGAHIAQRFPDYYEEKLARLVHQSK